MLSIGFELYNTLGRTLVAFRVDAAVDKRDLSLFYHRFKVRALGAERSLTPPQRVDSFKVLRRWPPSTGRFSSFFSYRQISLT
jgi:hypothetical protein